MNFSIFELLLKNLYESVMAKRMQPSPHERMIFLCGVALGWRFTQDLPMPDSKEFKQTIEKLKKFDQEVEDFLVEELPRFHGLYCADCAAAMKKDH